MIVAEGVEKYYRLDSGAKHYVYRNLNFSVPANTNVGIIGRNGVGKSTLIRMLGGADKPSKGTLTVQGHVAPPLGLRTSLLAKLSGRENAKFICRIRGDDEARMRERLRYIQEFAELDKFFFQPVRTYSSGMRARLTLALSMAFHYDYYLIDELTAVGDEKFRVRVDQAFRSLRGIASIVLVSHSMQTLRDWCDAGLYIRNGSAHYFDNIGDAISAYMSDNT